MWTDELFDEFYVKVNKYIDWDRTKEEVDFLIEALEIEPLHSILDVPCGFGRHCIVLTRKGYNVTGIDYHQAQVKAAHDLMKKENVGFTILRADMRNLQRKNCYDRIFNFFSSFGYFDDEGNRKVLEEFYRSLKPGGRLLVDVSNRDSALMTYQPSGVAKREDGSILIDQRWFEPLTSRMKGMFTLIEPDASVMERPIDIRLYSVHELRQMFIDTGFTDIKIYGAEFQEFWFGSTRIFMTGKKPQNAT
jgi:SAM-dependent methyltransferase